MEWLDFLGCFLANKIFFLIGLFGRFLGEKSWKKAIFFNFFLAKKLTFWEFYWRKNHEKRPFFYIFFNGLFPRFFGEKIVKKAIFLLFFSSHKIYFLGGFLAKKLFFKLDFLGGFLAKKSWKRQFFKFFLNGLFGRFFCKKSRKNAIFSTTKKC